jgi:hypothetical protein
VYFILIPVGFQKSPTGEETCTAAYGKCQQAYGNWLD